MSVLRCVTGYCHSTAFGSCWVKSCLAQCFIVLPLAMSGVYSSVVDPFLSHPYSFLFPQSLPHILYPHLSACCLLLLLLPTPLLFLQQTSLGLVQCLCSGFCVPRWQCVRKQRDTDGLGRAIGFQVLLWCLAALCLCLTKSSSPEQYLHFCLSSCVTAIARKPTVVCNTGVAASREHKNRVAFVLIEGCECFALAAPQSWYQRVQTQMARFQRVT